MLLVLAALSIVSLANALIAFGVAFYWQTKVVFTLGAHSNRDGGNVPRNALDVLDFRQSNFGRFIAGEIYPELKHKWLKAIGYVAVSFLTAFLCAWLLQTVNSA